MTRFLLGLLLSVALGSACAQNTSSQDKRRSGFEDMGATTQAMQKDDALNPGMLWVQDGEALWKQPAGASGKACISCHAAAQSSMRGVAARYPAFDASLGRPITLGHESQDLLGLESYVALQSRGLPLAPPEDARLEPYRQRGQQLFMQRMGQLNLSCAQCHDGLPGKRLAGNVIPEAHPTGYPVYRLEWQAMGSLQRRLRGCMSGIRAEPFAYGAQELVELELYLAARAKGMAMEAPGVRP
jgi:sulfur-oxidizing protein SoxA